MSAAKPWDLTGQIQCILLHVLMLCQCSWVLKRTLTRRVVLCMGIFRRGSVTRSGNLQFISCSDRKCWSLWLVSYTGCNILAPQLHGQVQVWMLDEIVRGCVCELRWYIVNSEAAAYSNYFKMRDPRASSGRGEGGQRQESMSHLTLLRLACRQWQVLISCPRAQVKSGASHTHSCKGSTRVSGCAVTGPPGFCTTVPYREVTCSVSRCYLVVHEPKQGAVGDDFRNMCKYRCCVQQDSCQRAEFWTDWSQTLRSILVDDEVLLHSLVVSTLQATSKMSMDQTEEQNCDAVI